MLTTHCDYVADTTTLEPGKFDITDYDTASAAVTDYLYARLTAVVETWKQRPVVMLSGGIDRKEGESGCFLYPSIGLPGPRGGFRWS